MFSLLYNKYFTYPSINHLKWQPRPERQYWNIVYKQEHRRPSSITRTPVFFLLICTGPDWIAQFAWCRRQAEQNKNCIFCNEAFWKPHFFSWKGTGPFFNPWTVNVTVLWCLGLLFSFYMPLKWLFSGFILLVNM